MGHFKKRSEWVPSEFDLGLGNRRDPFFLKAGKISSLEDRMNMLKLIWGRKKCQNFRATRYSNKVNFLSFDIKIEEPICKGNVSI